MGSRLRRAGGDLLVSIGVLGAVLGVLVSVDPRVREQLHAAGRVTSLDGLQAMGRQLHSMGLILFDAAWAQSIENAPLVVFTVVALVLLFAMTRS